jgi:hypothetical protein
MTLNIMPEKDVITGLERSFCVIPPIKLTKMRSSIYYNGGGLCPRSERAVLYAIQCYLASYCPICPNQTEHVRLPGGSWISCDRMGRVARTSR